MNTPAQELLLKIREHTGWSEPRIATEIKTSQATVNRLLNGQPGCQVSTYLAIESLAKRLKLRSKRRQKPSRGAQQPPAPQPESQPQ
jgi:transcriptional regulator with XRE-family HTH domain